MKPLVSAVVVTGHGGSSAPAASRRARCLGPHAPSALPGGDRNQSNWVSDLLDRGLGATGQAAMRILESWRSAPISSQRFVGAAERRAASVVERWLGETSDPRAKARARRGNTLELCLRALADQSLSPMDYEIIVVDEAASDLTRGVVTRLAADHPKITFNYVRPAGRRDASALRHVGWRDAQAELIAFTRDDCVPDRFWLEAGLVAFQRPEADGIVFADGRIEGARAPVHCNCFARRAALLEVEGLDIGGLRHRFGAQAFAHVPQATVRRSLPHHSAPRSGRHMDLHVISLGAAMLGLMLRRPGLVLAGIASWLSLAPRVFLWDEWTRPGRRARKSGGSRRSSRLNWREDVGPTSMTRQETGLLS